MTKDILSSEEILSSLEAEFKNVEVCVLECVDSTNTFAKQKVLEGARHGYVVVANKQTMGRGRQGNSFFSPKGTGIYFSIVLKSDIAILNAVKITTAASVAVAKAIEKVAKVQVGIKWVNDIYIGTKKVCGILTESMINCTNDGSDAIVIGVGININPPDNGYPAAIEEIATDLTSGNTDEIFSRNQLIAEIINQLLNMWEDICRGNEHFISEYRNRSIVLGREIVFIENSDEREVSKNGMAVDIDNDGGLVVKVEEGEYITLNSGEISVRVW